MKKYGKDRGFWENVIAAHRGGLTQAQAAKRYGVSRAALKYWITKLDGARAEGPEMLPVRTTDDAAPRIELDIGGVTLRVPDDTDTGYVAALVRALRSC